jgi:hypothetical protein
VLRALAGITATHRGLGLLAVTHSEVIRTVERAIDVDAPPVPHLQGRWLQVGTSVLSQPVVRAGPCTAGRRDADVAAAGALDEESR